jgi:dipeptidyl aminopeptidase/acylaminoacyl peptidase
MKISLLIMLLFISILAGAQDAIQFSAVDSPCVFGPGVISDGFSNRDMAISPDGNDLYYTLQWTYGAFSVILHAQKINAIWTTPETASFSGQFNDLEPAFSPDGRRLYFTSNRPLQGGDSSKKDYDIWYLDKKEGGWSGPYNLGPVINTDKDEFYPSTAKNGNLYFTRDNGDSKDDIFMSIYRNGKYESPSPLPATINSKGYDFNSFIDPDENYIIFSSYKRTDDLGGGDLYFSLRKNAEWQPAVHFGNEINSSSLDYSPFVSPDRKYFFFTSKKQLVKFPFLKALTAGEIRRVLTSYGNGNDDIYILNFKVIDEIMRGLY